MTESGSNAPSTKLTAAGIGTAAAAMIGRLVADRTGFVIEPWLIDLLALALGMAIAYFVPELNPSVSAVQALRRRT